MADGTPPVSTSKSSTPAPKAIKPRAVTRKTKAEREQFAKEESERQRKRDAENAKKTAAPTTRGGRGGRGRGGAVANAENRTLGVGAGSGVFGSSTASRPERRSGVNGGYSEMLEGQEGVKSEDVAMRGVEAGGGASAGGGGGGGGGSGGGGGGRGKLAPGAVGNGIELSEDDEPDEARRDIERIWISSDDEEDDEEDAVVASKGKQRAKERSIRAGATLRPVRAPRAIKEEDDELPKKSRTRASSSGATKNPEDDFVYEVDQNEMDMDDPEQGQIVKEPPSSPELSKKNKILKKASTKSKDIRPATETIEEKAERIRLTEDVRKLQDEFLSSDHTMKHGEDEAEDARAGKIFLFQLPPLMPYLVDPAAPLQEKIKQEGEATAAFVPPSTTPTSKSSSGNGNIKKEDGAAPAAPKLNIEGCYTATDELSLPAGLVGKLRVHKSGKVSLDWGGADMEVRYGTEVDFLQDAVMVETAKEGDKGTTYALGQVHKKLVVIPDWSKLYD